MKKVLLLLSIFCLCPAAQADKPWLSAAQVESIAGAENFAALTALCGNFVVPKHVLHKYELSGGISHADPRAGSLSLIGGPSLSANDLKNLYGRNCSIRPRISLYAMDATKVAYYSRYDCNVNLHFHPRHYSKQKGPQITSRLRQHNSAASADYAGCFLFANGCGCVSSVKQRHLSGGI
ncbi:MAG: hypothetical protein K1X79_01780 [Oligoflexia bacterium]|nr:hypothetical protein [Oligoflexia bacterium]